MSDQTTEEPGKLTRDQILWYWEWIVHEDTLFASRVNFFIAAEALLFAAFAALLGNFGVITSHATKPIVFLLIECIGVLFALMWLYTATIQIYLTMRPLKEILNRNVPEYRVVTHGRIKFPGPNHVLGVFFPIAVVLAWAAFFLIDAGGVRSYIVTLACT